MSLDLNLVHALIYLKSYPTKKYFKNFHKETSHKIPSLKSLGFEKVEKKFPSEKIPTDIIKDYDKTRDSNMY